MVRILATQKARTSRERLLRAFETGSESRAAAEATYGAHASRPR